MAVRTRRSVWSLPPGDETLNWYRKAVGVMLKRPASDPTSWVYRAAVHGEPSHDSSMTHWNQCQHQSWFFLPWHRGYITAFEATVAAAVDALGGPKDWALPYWDYSESLHKNPKARHMPPAFLNPIMPDGTNNFMWSRRAKNKSGDFGIDSAAVSLHALTTQDFTSTTAGAVGFGGPDTGFSHSGTDNGGLESIPHNRIHVLIGGASGFMADPDTAALDPIFWLHHCNIDRLWEVWRNQGPKFFDPTSQKWLSTLSFPMHDGAGTPFDFTCQDMLDTTKVLHGYQYDHTPVAHEPPVVAEEAMVAASAASELAGSNEGPLPLTGDVGRTTVILRQQLTTKSFTEALAPTPRHVYLRLENVTGQGAPGDFDIYVETPDGVAHLVGVLTTFGLGRSSDPNLPHGGSGLNQVFDITALAGPLGLDKDPQAKIPIRLERRRPAETEEAAPPGLESFAHRPVPEPSIQIGKVSVYFD
jgi:tyrosinase